MRHFDPVYDCRYPISGGDLLLLPHSFNDRQLAQVAKRLGVRPATLTEYFRTGIRLEQGVRP